MFLRFIQYGENWSLKDKLTNSVDQFLYLSRNILSTERDIDLHTGKSQTTIEKLSTIEETDISIEMKLEFLLMLQCRYCCILYHLNTYEIFGEKTLMVSTQGCYVLFWTNFGSSNQQNSISTIPSHKPSKGAEHDLRSKTDTERTNL